ncbi:MAG: PQQ-dependent sugar dehydrogenase [Cytophagaceae bacterium]
MSIYHLRIQLFMLGFLILPGLLFSQKKSDVQLILPEGFHTITVTAKSGKARHMAVDKNGTVYLKLKVLLNGKGILMLKDKNGDGKADMVKGFGNYIGTGIAIYNNYLYASSDSAVFRYPLGKEGPDESKMERIVSGLSYNPQHEAKSITIDKAGKLYVNIGAPSNACQEKDRTKGSAGMDPCPLLENYCGIWQFDASKINQKQSDGTRYATGIRNAIALDWDTKSGQLYAVPHGRDQLNTLYPEYFSDAQNAELPSEEFFQIIKDGNYGWPYCYYDHLQSKKVLAPEYGGDGQKVTERCEAMQKPIMAFPGHWAPNDLLFYHGNMFPEKYKDGAFIAFHGSWNRAPLKQGGYFVAFVPFKDGKPSGKWEVFAEGFAGGKEVMSPSDAKHRPMGLAEGPDGSLYISDSVQGTVWKIVYTQTK